MIFQMHQKALLSSKGLIHLQVDDAGKGWLEGEDVMIALRGVNSRLTEAEEEYLYRVSNHFMVGSRISGMRVHMYKGVGVR